MDRSVFTQNKYCLRQASMRLDIREKTTILLPFDGNYHATNHAVTAHTTEDYE